MLEAGEPVVGPHLRLPVLSSLERTERRDDLLGRWIQSHRKEKREKVEEKDRGRVGPLAVW